MKRYCISVLTGYGPGPGGFCEHWEDQLFDTEAAAWLEVIRLRGQGLTTSEVMDLENLPF